MIFYFLLLLLAACDQEKPKDPLPGARVSLLIDEAALTIDPDAAQIRVALPPQEENNAWSHEGYDTPHVVPHVKAFGLNEVVWTTNIGRGNGGTHEMPTSPIGGDGAIYAMDADHNVVALDAATGNEKWSLSAPSTKYVGGGLAYEKGSLFATFADGWIIKLDGKTGALLWKKKLPALLRSAPTVRGRHLYVMTTTNRLIAMDLESGDVIWTYVGLEESISFAGGASPAASDFVVLAPTTSGDVVALHPANGYTLWSDRIGSFRGLDSSSMISQVRALPVVHGDFVFAISNSDHMVALDLKTGQRLWEKPLGGTVGPVVADDFIFVVTNHNDLLCLTRQTGRVVWVHALPMYENEAGKKGRITWSGPILAGDQLIVVGSNKQALALSPEDGQVMTTFELPGSTHLPPIAMEGRIYVLTDQADLVAIR